jgi:hypothetical protein
MYLLDVDEFKVQGSRKNHVNSVSCPFCNNDEPNPVDLMTRSG